MRYSCYFYWTSISYFNFRSSTRTQPSPCPSLAEVRKHLAAILSANMWYFNQLSCRQSCLLKTTILFLSLKISPLYCCSYCQRILYYYRGSEWVISSMKIRILVLQMCRRNSNPRPLLWWAPSIMPGISAMVIPKSSTNFTWPTDGFRVVNSQLAILGRARVTAARKVDLPILGNPTSPMSARVFNYRYIVFLSPQKPILYSSNMPGFILLPLPPVPPLATTHCCLSKLRSARRCLVYLSQRRSSWQMRVPEGTRMRVLPPFLPILPLEPPFFPSTPQMVLRRRWERSCMEEWAWISILPPLPPSPPQGLPLLTLLSVKQAMAPLPPSPALTTTLTLSEKFLSQNLEILVLSFAMVQVALQKRNWVVLISPRILIQLIITGAAILVPFMLNLEVDKILRGEVHVFVVEWK